MTELLNCPFCGGKARKSEGLNEFWISCMSCQASSLMRGNIEAAISAWNTRSLPAQEDPVAGEAIFSECAEIALEHVGQGPAGTDLVDVCRRIGYDDACREIADAIKLRASNRKTMDAIADAALLKP